MTVVYGPNRNDRRADLWNEIMMVRLRKLGPWVTGGDFNVVRFSEEKKKGI